MYGLRNSVVVPNVAIATVLAMDETFLTEGSEQLKSRPNMRSDLLADARSTDA